jgi:hypothetical protein
LVAQKGTPELIAAMDSGDVSISAAARIATQPKSEQVVIVTMAKDQRKEAVRQIQVTVGFDKEADEQRARDNRLFMGLFNAVKLIGDFREEPKEVWDGLWRLSA